MAADEKLKMIRMMRDKLSRTSWTVTAESMYTLLEQLDEQDVAENAARFAVAAKASDATRAKSVRK
jgi:hypothetical protein